MFTKATVMTDEMVTVVVDQLNKAFNVPFASEEREAAWIRFLIQIAKPYVPGWALQAMGSAAAGVKAEDLKQLEDTLTAEINKVVDIKWVPEPIEEAVIRKVVAEMLGYCLVGKAIV